ncbi:MAG TPA: hypothetical protein VMW75_02680 [Thermoanaerobaculia bacterium]|nr:hypothetical protein [Thermoanaerobaculia bacterium]
MPLVWQGNDNPYRTNYFRLLELGPPASPGTIVATRQKLAAKIQAGNPHLVAGREVSEAEITGAESRLLDERSRAWEVLLVHPVPGPASKRLQQLCRAIAEEATPAPAPRVPRLGNVRALAALLPLPGPDDIALPSWDELGIPGPEAWEDRRLDIQFDL